MWQRYSQVLKSKVNTTVNALRKHGESLGNTERSNKVNTSYKQGKSMLKMTVQIECGIESCDRVEKRDINRGY